MRAEVKHALPSIAIVARASYRPCGTRGRQSPNSLRPKYDRYIPTYSDGNSRNAVMVLREQAAVRRSPLRQVVAAAGSPHKNINIKLHRESARSAIRKTWGGVRDNVALWPKEYSKQSFRYVIVTIRGKILLEMWGGNPFWGELFFTEGEVSLNFGIWLLNCS